MGAVEMERVGCSSLTFRRFPLDEALAAMVELGIRHVEIGAFPDFAPHFDLLGATAAEEDALVELVGRHDINVRSFNTAVGPFNEPGVDAERWRQGARRVMRVAQRLGAKAVGVAGGRPIDRQAQSLEEHIAIMAGHIRPMAMEAQQLGLRLSIEAPHSGGLVRDADEALRLLRAVDHPNAALILDVAHHHRAGWSMPRAVEAIGGRIEHVHLRDHDGAESVYPLGAGRVDFAALFEALEHVGYRGIYAFEMPEAGATIDQAKQTVARSMEFLRSLRW